MRNAAAAAVLALAVLAGCTAAPPPAPTNTLVRPTDTPAPVPTATPLAAPTATPVPAILTAGPVNYLPSPEQIPAAYVYAPQRERLLTQPNLSGVLRTYSRLDTSRNEGLVQIGVTVADTEEAAALIFASSMNGWAQQGYVFEPLSGLGELAVIGRRSSAAPASALGTPPESIIIYFRRGILDGVVLWSDAAEPPAEDNVMRIARDMDARAQANPPPTPH